MTRYTGAMRRFLFTALAVVSLASCGPRSTGPTVPQGDPFAPRRLFPLARGYVCSYDADAGTGGPPTLTKIEVLRADDDRFEVGSMGSESRVYEMREDGIYRPDAGVWLLHGPITEGASWETTLGRTATVTSITREALYDGETKRGCVEVEERGGDSGRVTVTTYCPDLGAVLIEETQEMQLGPPVRVVARVRLCSNGEE